MGSYRGRLDIIADILNVTSANSKKTRIMFQANLSYKVLQKYLGEITKASLINFEAEKQCYILTGKGRDFLDTYKEYCKNNQDVEKRLNYVNNSKKALEELCQGS